MKSHSGLLALSTASAVMCAAGFMPSASVAAAETPITDGSYAVTHGLSQADVKHINELNEKASSLGNSKKPSEISERPNPSASSHESAAADDRETPAAEPLNAMPTPYWASGGRATTDVSNYIRKWQQVYSHRDGQIRQMGEEDRERLSYGCVGVTWVNSGVYPTNKLAFSFFDKDRHEALKKAGPLATETQAEFEGRIAKASFDEEKGFKRAHDVASVMNKALEGSQNERAYVEKLTAELAKNNDALLNDSSWSNVYTALRNTPSFRTKDGGNFNPSKMKAVIYSKHFWSGQGASQDKRKFGDPDAFRPNQATGLVNMSMDRNIARSPAKPGEGFINFDYGWFGDQTVVDSNKSVWTHANHYHSPNGDMGRMDVYESRFQNWASGYADFDRGAYVITFIPKSWNTAPAKVEQGWR